MEFNDGGGLHTVNWACAVVELHRDRVGRAGEDPDEVRGVAPRLEQHRLVPGLVEADQLRRVVPRRPTPAHPAARGSPVARRNRLYHCVTAIYSN